ncbi:MAG: hypothetical protein WEA61_08750 [Anaerolineales bacterium]
MRYARLLHDFHWMKYPSRTRTPGWAGLRSTPETVPLWVTPRKSSNKDDLPLGPSWEAYLRGINNERSFKFIMWPPAGWFNKNKNADTLGFAGNVVEVLGTEGSSARVKTFNLADRPPDPATWNFESHPELVHKFTVITRGGEVINPAEGIDAYIFLIGRKPLYIPLNRLEFFASLPAQIKINITTIPWLLVKDVPGKAGKNINKCLPLEKVTVYEYALRGTYVWGRTDKGWIALCWYPVANNCRYFTSWRMKTIPPVPPRVA